MEQMGQKNCKNWSWKVLRWCEAFASRWLTNTRSKRTKSKLCHSLSMVSQKQNYQQITTVRSLSAYANLAIGSFITAQVMTFTKGSVGILFSSPRLKMPENISQIPALLPPILALVYNCTLIIKETAQLLKDESRHINLNPFRNSDYFFPDSFVPESKDSLKKRKVFSVWAGAFFYYFIHSYLLTIIKQYLWPLYLRYVQLLLFLFILNS